PLNGKALAQPVDYRDEAARVGGVSGPHFGANRPAVAIKQHGEDHLIEIRPMVLGEAALAKGLAALSLEIETGGVHEHKIERAEQIAPTREKVFLDNVLHAARREGRGAILLIRGQPLAKPGHRPVEVMQVEALNAIDRVVLTPAVRRPIGAAGKQAMQDGQEHRAFERETMLAGRGEVFDRPPATRLLPQALEDQGGSDASRRARRRRSLGEGVDNDGFGGETRARSQQALQLSALAQILDAAERGDHLLAHLRALAAALDDLEIGAAARGFLAEIHGAEPFSRLIRGAHIINNYTKYIKGNIQTRGTTFSPASPLAPNKFNGLARQSQPQLLKISQRCL